MVSSSTIAVLGVCAGFAAAWVAQDWRWDAKWSEFEAQAYKQASEVAAQSYKTSTAWRDLADLANNELKSDYAAVEKQYQDALSRIRDLGAELDRVRANSANDGDAMPANSRPAAGSSTACKCRPCEPNSRIMAGTLRIARDCDLLAVRYNKLLGLYNGIKEAQQ